MAPSDSMFLFEIVVEELKSYINCQEFYIRSQFADVFTLSLKDPNELNVLTPKCSRKKELIGKTKVRDKKLNKKSSTDSKMQTGQSVLLIYNIDLLKSRMKNYQMELSVGHKDYLEDRLGSSHVPWSYVFIDFLNRLHWKEELSNVSARGEYKIFDEISSKRIASITLNIKLTYLKDKITTEFRSLSQRNQQTFMYTGFNFTPSTILSTVKQNPLTPINIMEETGVIQTLYSGKKKKNQKTIIQNKNKNLSNLKVSEKIDPKDKSKVNMDETFKDDKSYCQAVKSIRTPARSDTDVTKCKLINLIKSNSYTAINREQHNILNYIFGGNNGPFGNNVYCVGYFTVENDFNRDVDSSKSSVKKQSSEGKSEESKERYKFKICDSECPSRKDTDNTCSQSMCSLDLPAEAANLISITKCKQVECDNRKHKEVPPPPDDRILLDMSGLNKECCAITEKVEEVVGGMKAKMKFQGQPCFCSCECTFGFTKKTTYCTVCGGYEITGDDMPNRTAENTSFPCPIYHKLIDKNKLKTWSTSGSDSKKKPEDSQKSFKGGPKSVGSDKRSIGAEKSAESEKESKKEKKKKKDDRFKFNYGYQGIPPQIGHSQCTFPCTGTLGAVPKHMGWLWTAENVPGMKFRPMWKPGATNKHVVRLLRMARNPGEVIAKKKKKDATKKKRPLRRPLLVVQKKEGEYIVTMETMKAYAKPRAINQVPFEDKLPLTYTIGRSEEENLERQRRKEREQRRQERAQRQFIQSAFRDVCRDICLKTYQQALGLLPDAEKPQCPCYPAVPDAEHTNVDVSCSCSETKLSIGSDTDSDEWIVEFTPPNAMFDPSFKGKKVIKSDNSSQYTYLDYKVKLLDRYGNPVPRFFKGPDGKQQCSDLGGFWSPEHKWLEINVDGYVAPDGRWAPNAFNGPNGEPIDTDTGKFQVTGGKWLVVGIDGYVDSQGRWKFYSRPRDVMPQKRRGGCRKGAGDKPDYRPSNKKSETTWSCFGDITPRQLSKMGIVGHGQDKKLLLSALKNILASGEDVKIPEPSIVPRLAPSKKQKQTGKQGTSGFYNSRTYFTERQKCRHPVPPEKGVISVDAHGRKTYFKLKDYNNKRPKDRVNALKDYGISLSDFHEPCFHSFINTETLRQQHLERLMAKMKCASTQIGVAYGWKPGAISKRLLRKLNKAKVHRSANEEKKPAKKLKKRIENKPTLIISRKNGAYRVEMQVTGEKETEYTPVVYKIENESNAEKQRQEEMHRRRVIRKAVDEVWSDPYHPELCEEICYKSYQQAIGILPYDAYNPDCICSDEEIETVASCSCDDEDASSHSSSDIEWEIHFSPPYAHYS